MYKTKTLIIGASFLGIGYATANQDCIIIEKGENPVPDFVGCASLNRMLALPTTEMRTAASVWMKTEMFTYIRFPVLCQTLFFQKNFAL